MSIDNRERITNLEYKPILEGVYHYILMQDFFYKLGILFPVECRDICISDRGIDITTGKYIFTTDGVGLEERHKISSIEVVEILREEFIFDEEGC